MEADVLLAAGRSACQSLDEGARPWREHEDRKRCRPNNGPRGMGVRMKAWHPMNALGK